MAIWTGGQISGGTVFFDANKDGTLDYLDLNGDGLQEADEPGEVSTVTGADGYFSLTIPAVFHLNGNGVVDASEGQFVAVGGFDSWGDKGVSDGLEIGQ